MWRIFNYFLVTLCGSMLWFTSFNAQADDTTTVTTPVTTPEGTPAQQTVTTVVKPNGTVERQTIITTTPAAKEVVTMPSGYNSCFKVDAGWYNDVWVPAHQVCQYNASSEGVAWVEGYWACTQYTGGNCTNWDWKSGHWVKTMTVY